MDNKTIKQHLKEAHRAIKEKNVEIALLECKTVLKLDRNNYKALVLLGAALQETDQRSEAPNAFMKAIDVSSDQILAYQGLASYYEKYDADNDNLLPVYNRLLSLEKDLEKFKDLLQKFERCCSKRNDPKIGIISLESILHSDERDKIEAIVPLLGKLFMQMKDIPSDCSDCYKKFLPIVVDCDECPNRKEFFKRYLKLLYTKKEYDALYRYCNKMLQIYENEVYPLEWICRIYYELATSDDLSMIEQLEDSIDNYLDEILSLDEGCVAALMAKAVSEFYKREYISTRDLLIFVIDAKPQLWQAWYWLMKTYEILQCYSDVLQTLSQLKTYLPSHLVAYNDILDTISLRALSRLDLPEKCEMCIQQCLSILQTDSDNIDAMECFVRCSLFLNNLESSKSMLDKLLEISNPINSDVLLLRCTYYVKTGYSDEAVSLLLNYIENVSDEVSNIWLLLGELYLQHGINDKAFDSFLRAAKAGPYLYKVFSRLGDYYRDIVHDVEKAVKCYQKAFRISPQSDEVGIALSDIYKKERLSENNFELLEMATKTNGRKWAWLRLGLQHLDNGDSKRATDNLRCAVRLDSNDSHCWECLADACVAHGSYQTALKCYEKCKELNAGSVYCLLQIATIKQLTGLYDESLTEFRAIISENPNYIPALKGFAEALLLNADELFRMHSNGLSRDLCQEAVSALIVALRNDNSLSCLWKLLADVCMRIVRLPYRLVYLEVPLDLFAEDPKYPDDVDSDVITLYTAEILKLARKCYFAVLHINKESDDVADYIWYDIAYCYNQQAEYTADSNDKSAFRRQAFAYAKKGVCCLPKCWQNWNLMALISLSTEINNFALAQHCFIKAINLERNNAVVWFNLGTMYLMVDNVKLANEAFGIAQSVDPEFALPWAGQALIAESVNHEDTVDLFYHSLQLAYHSETAKGFAEWILKLLKNWPQNKSNELYYCIIEKLFGPRIAALYLNWYIDYYPNDACALNMLGVLEEWNGLYLKSSKHLRNGIANLSGEQRDIAYCNLGHVYLQLKSYDESVLCYECIKTMDFSSQCGLALAQFKRGDLTTAYNTYETTLNWFTPEDQTVSADITVAKAFVMYASENDADIFYKCLQIKPIPIHALFAACALGLLKCNWNLCELTLKELEKHELGREFIYDITYLNALFYFVQGQYTESVSYLTGRIMHYPWDASLWFIFCTLMLHSVYEGSDNQYADRAESAARFARCAISLGQMNIDISKMHSIMSLCYLLCGQINKSLQHCSDAIHIFPNVPENWAVFIAVHYTTGADSNLIRKYVSFVRRRMPCARNLNTWLANMERKLATIT